MRRGETIREYQDREAREQIAWERELPWLAEHLLPDEPEPIPLPVVETDIATDAEVGRAFDAGYLCGWRDRQRVCYRDPRPEVAEAFRRGIVMGYAQRLREHW